MMDEVTIAMLARDLLDADKSAGPWRYPIRYTLVDHVGTRLAFYLRSDPRAGDVAIESVQTDGPAVTMLLLPMRMEWVDATGKCGSAKATRVEYDSPPDAA